MDTKVKRDNVEDQRIVGKLVDREVYHCLSYLISHFAKHPDSVEDYDDVLRICSRPQYTYEFEYICESCEDHEEEERWYASQNDQSEYLDWVDCDVEDYKDECPNCGKDTVPFYMDCHESDDKEAYEHWAVSSWLAAKLEEKGEIVGELFDFHVWGRCTTGQAIHLDSVMIEIASDMEILSGQRNSWDK